MRADKQRNKEKILQNAEELLTGNNIDTITLEEIAKAAEVTRATLYNHFQTKTELLKEMVLPALNSITKDLKEKNRSKTGSFHHVTSALFEMYGRYRQTLELATCQTLYGDTEVAAAHKEFMEEFKKAMQKAGAEDFPLGMQTSLRLIAATYLPVLTVLNKENNLTLSLFHSIMEGVLNL